MISLLKKRTTILPDFYLPKSPCASGENVDIAVHGLTII